MKGFLLQGKNLSRLRGRLKSALLVRIAVYLLLVDLAFVFAYPFLYMMVTSLKSPQDVRDITVNWLPSGLHWNNYRLSFSLLGYPSALARTVLVVGGCTLGHLFSCSFVGYGFARFSFRGKSLFFLLLLLSIIVPVQTIIVPEYIFFSGAGFLGTYLPMMVPSWLGFGLSGGLFIFIFRLFYISLPRSLEEAAGIDGCGAVSTFFRIALPASRSSVMVCLVLSLVWHWNDYFEPLIYITQQKKYLLPMLLPGLYRIMGGMQDASLSGGDALGDIYTEAVAMAATFLVVLPLLIAYLFLQKKFVQGVERSGITGE
ncbi:MAG: carbohydrate ABC transporter permease [Oscillospiraceae bacterium]|nr:carbohydrate ABC transporter permease [Oscillospiraceae bacterium]